MDYLNKSLFFSRIAIPQDVVPIIFFQKYSKKHRTSEASLIETTPGKSATGKARLDEVRKKRRERHARKKIIPQ